VTFPCGRSNPLRILPFLLAAAACGGEGGPHVSRIDVVGLDGVEAALKERRGQGVLLNFWAIWCPPCVAELPDLAEVAEEYSGRGGVLLTVNYDLMLPGEEAASIVERVREFLRRKNFSFDVLVYDGPGFDAINERFDLPGPVPMTLAFDREGNVVGRHEGQGDRARFSEMMRRALGP